MAPGWLLYTMSTLQGAFFGTFLTLLFNKSKYWIPFLILYIFIFLLTIFLYFNNDRIKKEEERKHDRSNVSGVNVVDLLPENLPEQNSMLKGSTRPSLPGMIFIGRRHNLIKATWYKNYFNNEIKTIKQNSRLAVSDKIKEQLFIIPPNKTCEIDFIGNPKIDRKDYLFSIYSYTDKNDFKDIGLSTKSRSSYKYLFRLFASIR